jgi:hypothetical protein
MKVGDAQMLLSLKEGGLWELDAAEQAAWEALDGRWPVRCEECDETQMRLCFALYALGVLDLRWARGVTSDEVDLGKAVQAS